MNQKISNKEFEEAYKDTTNNKIIRKAMKKYIQYMPKEEIKNCGMIALWKSLKKFNPEKNMKFTSFLYRMVCFECMGFIGKDKKIRTYKTKERLDPKPIDELSLPYMSGTNYDEFDDMISVLPKKLAKIVKLRIVYNMSFEEIGRINKFSHETARRKLKLAYSKLKNEHTALPE